MGVGLLQYGEYLYEGISRIDDIIDHQYLLSILKVGDIEDFDTLSFCCIVVADRIDRVDSADIVVFAKPLRQTHPPSGDRNNRIKLPVDLRCQGINICQKGLTVIVEAFQLNRPSIRDRGNLSRPVQNRHF